MDEAWLLPAITGATFAFLLIFGRYLPRGGDWLAVGAGAATFVVFLFILGDLLDAPRDVLPQGRGWDWINFEGFEIRLGFEVDEITVVMLAVVTFVGSLIVLYSTGYMHDDARYGWFFTVLMLFITSMLTLVLADNLLLLYAAWEGVGFCSFLLIGFWHERRSAAEAAKKAFVTTRIGDVGLLIGIILFWRATGTFDISEIIEAAEHGEGLLGDGTYLTLATLLLFAGAAGKSAQFPLHVWLPDAMEGPTPVSALIHAATMVVAGVYLVARMMPVFVAADPIALDVITAIGLTTVFISVLMGLVMTDIKRVIAYSTINSLGLMFVALGSTSVTAAMLYLLTHGFFKALLFMAAGSVIHGTEEQEVTRLGGLIRKMPITGWTFAIGALAMAGLAPLSGYWAKDEILVAIEHRQNISVLMLASVSVFITAIYIGRVFYLAFLGEPRDHYVYDHAHESPPVMTLPLVVLALLSVVSGFVVFSGIGEALGFDGGFGEFVFFEEPEEFHFDWIIGIGSLIAVVAGLALVPYFWEGTGERAREVAERFLWTHNLLKNKFYIDDIYQAFLERVVFVLSRIIAWFDRNVVNDTGVDGPAMLAWFAGFMAKFSQTGRLPNYALAISFGVVMLAIIAYAVEF
jgi:NADH-quinone oxidoreductase subunit L